MLRPANGKGEAGDALQAFVGRRDNVIYPWSTDVQGHRTETAHGVYHNSRSWEGETSLNKSYFFLVSTEDLDCPQV